MEESGKVRRDEGEIVVVAVHATTPVPATLTDPPTTYAGVATSSPSVPVQTVPSRTVHHRLSGTQPRRLAFHAGLDLMWLPLLRSVSVTKEPHGTALPTPASFVPRLPQSSTILVSVTRLVLLRS
jgi:hypothetical protein